MKGKASRGNTLSFGIFGIKALEPSWITSRQIEACRRSVEYWVFPVLPEKILFEITGLSETRAREAFRIASSKLPIKTRFVSLNDKV
uniref:ribosomal protein L16 n=1 Tax=Cephaleuros lagerheimii TaxID=2738443 RepID=UPI0030029573